MRKIGGKLFILTLSSVLLFARPVYADTKGVINSGKGLFVREKNNKKSEAIGSLNDKEQVEIVKATKNWYKIRFNTSDGKKFGYVLREYVQVSKSDMGSLDKKIKKDKTKKSEDKKKQSKKEVKKEKVEETKKPDKKDDEKVDTTKKSVKEDEKKDETQPNKNYQSVIIATNLLNVREKNSKKSKVIASVTANETYPIKEITKHWVKIALTDSLDGYVMRDYVDFSVEEVNLKNSENTAASNNSEQTDNNKEKPYNTKNKKKEKPFDNSKGEDPTIGSTIDEIIHHAEDVTFTQLDGKVAISTVAAVNVRQDTNTQSPILSMLLKGGKLQATGISDDWVRVEIDEDNGYIMKQYVNIEDGVIVNLPPDPNQHIAKDDSQIQSPTGNDGEAVVEFAKQFLGNPYVWGGTSLTRGTDCSGFVQGVYRHFGYNLKRTSAQQRTEGIEVPSLSEARAGDLICYNGHIGIYMGAGKGLIHASNPRSGIIMTANPSYRPILSIRRILR